MSDVTTGKPPTLFNFLIRTFEIMSIKIWALSNLVGLSIKELQRGQIGRRANDRLSLESWAERQKELKQLEQIHAEVETFHFILLEN